MPVSYTVWQAYIGDFAHQPRNYGLLMECPASLRQEAVPSCPCPPGTGLPGAADKLAEIQTGGAGCPRTRPIVASKEAVLKDGMMAWSGHHTAACGAAEPDAQTDPGRRFWRRPQNHRPLFLWIKA
jgi:hypothetical protein